jgi:hypothetical protein
MPAKELIRAWGRLAVAAIVAIGVAALMVAAPWSSDRVMLCETIQRNVALVANGEVARRASDAYLVRLSRDVRAANVAVEAGDFSGAWTPEQLRECLGAGWTPVFSTASDSARAESWAFVRHGGPTVTYTESFDAAQGEVRARVVIEALPAS